jgi:hypothetical protein
MVSIFGLHGLISLEYLTFWCPPLTRSLAIYHANVGVQFRIGRYIYIYVYIYIYRERERGAQSNIECGVGLNVDSQGV